MDSSIREVTTSATLEEKKKLRKEFRYVNYLFGGNAAANAFVEIVIALLFIWGTTWCAIMSLRFGKWLSVFGSYVKLGLFVVFVLLALTFFFGGHSTGQHLGWSDLV